MPNPLYRKRIEAGLSADALAREIGVTVTSIYGWEKERHKPYPKHAKALSDRLDIPIGELISLEPRAARR